MTEIKQFFKNLIDNSNPQSGKTFAGLVILLTSSSLAISATIANHGTCPESIFNSLLIFGAACFGLQLGENIFKKAPVDLPAPVDPPAKADAVVDSPDA